MQLHAASGALAGLPPNRIEALVDGIFAVAMTILVLELHVPELAHGVAVSDEALASAVAHLLPGRIDKHVKVAPSSRRGSQRRPQP